MAQFVDAHGNLLKADVEALANSVNTVGVMGKGIALQFKNAFPANYKAYEAACKTQAVELGKMFVFDNGRLTRPHWIINFPTKGHWRAKSRIRDVAHGLDDLSRVIEDLRISSIALPALGCGLGGLDWNEVRVLVEERLSGLDVVVHLYAPDGAPDAADMVVATTRPRLTTSTAALVSMIDHYSQVALFVSLIEIQKLMYFLQQAGEDLKLRYQANFYGPYADNLRHVLKSLEGHQLEGFGDGSKKVHDAELVTVLPGAASEAAAVLAGSHLIVERMQRVLELVEGYESAYGLELLASVHWMGAQDGNGDDLESVIKRVQSWNRRKGRMFTAEHIESAWNRLREQGWLDTADADAVPAAAGGFELA
ncbi:MAG: macro domain-containing protein [Acidimicrobiaceae bacterium]|nr:macro domain-containing protein [Acidimicrobiaceae bacterium]MCY4176275.1 macro domain-containing protein [Acidimicrobiaceae bacterium]MCY4280253.1 macro domain-containing protein [Acidimicrobiaceae bacterium]MCY4293565.1 macro domain-containing protein [Acidimicrobiaceae bacterium]